VEERGMEGRELYFQIVHHPRKKEAAALKGAAAWQVG
jgi:hypothetical protein